MKTLIKKLFSTSSASQNLGLFVIRVGISLIFIKHGYAKMLAGTELWYGLGTKMNLLGITFLPTMWGFAAAASEFFGGICLSLGLGTRIASFFLCFTMFVAIMFHMSKGDPFGLLAHPLSLVIVFIGLMVAGGGTFSLDYFISNKNKKSVL